MPGCLRRKNKSDSCAMAPSARYKRNLVVVVFGQRQQYISVHLAPRWILILWFRVACAQRNSSRRQPQQHSSEHILAPLSSPNEALKTALVSTSYDRCQTQAINDDAWCVEGHRGRQRLTRERRGGRAKRGNIIHFSFSLSLLICRSLSTKK